MKKKNEVQISVIMPAYNCRRTLAEAMDSVLKQNVPLELIVIDDASPEPLDDILKKYEGDERVRVLINDANRGVSYSRNRGVRRAKGEWVAFLDSDDIWREGKLKKQMLRLKETGCVLCCTGREFMTPEGTPTGRIVPVPERITYDMLLSGNPINNSSILAKRKVLLEFEAARDDIHEDYAIWLKLLKKYGEVCAVNEPLLLYRRDPKSKSGSKLRSALMTYRTYRFVGMGIPQTLSCFVRYGINGVRKHLLPDITSVKQTAKMLFSMGLQAAMLPLHIIPVKKNRILFTGLTGGSGANDYSCNPKYLYEYLRDCGVKDPEFVWLASDPDAVTFLTDDGVRVEKHFTPAAFLMLFTSKVIISNGSYIPWFPFRKNQKVMNTWHAGGSYKRVEMERSTSRAGLYLKKQAVKNIDIFVSSCKDQTDHMIRSSYDYHGRVSTVGLPRNDILLSDEVSAAAAKAKAYYDIPADTRIALYVPTYRTLNPAVTLDTDAILSALESNGEKWAFLCRMHRYQDNDMGLNVTGSRIIGAADYPDVQELLCATDLMITDYSSIVWDYGLLERPGILFVPDEVTYTAETGFYTPFEKWPYSKVHSVEEMCELIRKMKKDPSIGKEQIESARRHFKEDGSYESGRAAEVLGKYIEKYWIS